MEDQTTKRSTSPEMENLDSSDIERNIDKSIVQPVPNSEIIGEPAVVETTQVSSDKGVTKTTVLQGIQIMNNTMGNIKNCLSSMRSFAQGESENNSAIADQSFFKHLKDEMVFFQDFASEFIQRVEQFVPESSNTVQNESGFVLQNSTDAEDSTLKNDEETAVIPQVAEQSEDSDDTQFSDLESESSTMESVDLDDFFNAFASADMGLPDDPPPYSPQPRSENDSQQVSNEPPAYSPQNRRRPTGFSQYIPTLEELAQERPARISMNFNDSPNDMGNSQFFVNYATFSNFDAQSNDQPPTEHFERPIRGHTHYSGPQPRRDYQAPLSVSRWHRNYNNNLNISNGNAHRFGQQPGFQSDHPPSYHEYYPNSQQNDETWENSSAVPEQVVSNETPQLNGFHRLMQQRHFNNMRRNRFFASNRNGFPFPPRRPTTVIERVIRPDGSVYSVLHEHPDDVADNSPGDLPYFFSLFGGYRHYF
ncbi:unnamed protein product [Caenorhabditis angaria]|uniref:Uncharacterized protein n=1 Tax=Caenorhabditis angaria TaxID=860376 RepID=A0A9P1J3R1_9PELO|nr:unnamed protein product [Caenorhabditis angaria]